MAAMVIRAPCWLVTPGCCSILSTMDSREVQVWSVTREEKVEIGISDRLYLLEIYHKEHKISIGKQEKVVFNFDLL